MKTRNMIVPSNVIKRHLIHPEPYGESIVELQNGLVTDVYTDEDGTLFTNTNNKALIHYLKGVKDEKSESLFVNQLELNPVSMNDLNQLLKWFKSSPLKRYDLIDNPLDILRLYLSHARTMNSNVFLVKNQNKPIGLLGFIMIDQIALINIELYEHEVANEDLTMLIDYFKSYITSHYAFDKILIHVPYYDQYLIDVLNQSSFNLTDGFVMIPTFVGTIKHLTYTCSK